MFSFGVVLNCGFVVVGRLFSFPGAVVCDLLMVCWLPLVLGCAPQFGFCGCGDSRFGGFCFWCGF